MVKLVVIVLIGRCVRRGPVWLVGREAPWLQGSTAPVDLEERGTGSVQLFIYELLAKKSKMYETYSAVGAAFAEARGEASALDETLV